MADSDKMLKAMAALMKSGEENEKKGKINLPPIVYKNVGSGKPLEIVEDQAAHTLMLTPFRYCAFCRKILSPIRPVIECGMCKRRAYCSGMCIDADYELDMNGSSQGHKDWCFGMTKAKVGEEGLDWQLVAVQGRGIGVRALRRLPQFARIIVEGMDFSKVEKVDGFESSAFTDKSKRSHYINHDCDPNAAGIFQELESGKGVTIVYAQREILEGEEITVNYTFFNDIDIRNIDLDVPVEQLLEAHREKLLEFGITCPSNCFCLMPGLRDQLIQNETLYNRIKQPVTREESKELVKNLLNGLKIVKSTPHELHKFLNIAMNCFCSVGGEDKLAEKLVAWDEIYCKNVPHPNSKESREYLELQSHKGKIMISVPKAIFVHIGVGKPMETQNNKEIIRDTGRFCAFCTTKIPREKIKRCSKCLARTYCSKDCQVKDWLPKGDGQGHKNWCGLKVCEESLDWEVVATKDRRLAIRAMRDIPAYSRIIVELVEDKKRGHLINHECDANAAETFYEPTKQKSISILYAKRDIREGEEICKSYTEFNSVNLNSSHNEVMTSHREKLKAEGILCLSDCFCRDEKICQQLQTNSNMVQHFATLLKPIPKVPQLVNVLKELIPGLEIVHGPPHELFNFGNMALQILKKTGTKDKEDLDLMEKWDKQFQLYLSNITHPKSKV